MEVRYLYNKETGEILMSFHSRHFVQKGDAFVDGGQDGFFRFSDNDGFSLKRVNLEEIMFHVRENMEWGVTRDKEGNLLEQVEYKKIKDLDSNHIQAILLTQKHISKFTREVLKLELKNRTIMNKGTQIIGNFNSTGDEAIDLIKQTASKLVDLIETHGKDPRRKVKAITDIEQGTMWAVKSLFNN